MYDYLSKNWLEWFGVVSGLLYLFLEIRQKSAMWVVGFVMSIVYVAVFYESKFYAGMSLSIYYSAVSIYGFWLWRFGVEKSDVEENPQIHYYKTGARLVTILFIIAVILFVVISQVLVRYTDSPVPYGDALVSSLSVVATWMVARKYIAHWVIWIFVNFVSVYLFALQELYPTMFLYLVYGVLSVYGYWKWNKSGIEKQTLNP